VSAVSEEAWSKKKQEGGGSACQKREERKDGFIPGEDQKEQEIMGGKED